MINLGGNKKSDNLGSNVLRTGDMNRSTSTFFLSTAGIFISFLIMSLISEKSVKIKINGENFAYPEVRLIIGYLLSFCAATAMRFVTKENISVKQLLDPIYKNENYIVSSVLLFFCESPCNPQPWSSSSCLP